MKSKTILPIKNHMVFNVKIITLLITAFLLPNSLAVTSLSVNEDGFLVIDGKPKLIIGLYQSSMPKDDEMVKELANNGFNLLRTVRKPNLQHSDIKADLDIFHKYNLYGWIYLHDTIILDKDDQQKRIKLTEMVEKFKDHPALLAWEIQDEILWHIWQKPIGWTFGEQQKELKKLIEESNSSQGKINELNKILEQANSYTRRGLWLKGEQLYDKLWAELGKVHPAPEMKLSKREAETALLTERLLRGREVIKKIDPKHFIYANHAPRNSIKSLRQVNDAIDIIGCDIYPAPTYRTQAHSDLDNKSLSSVGVYTKRMKAAAPGKPAWMVLQGFGWRDLKSGPCVGSDDLMWGRRPNIVELRLMVFDAILNGANGILYWGVHYAGYLEKDNQLRKDILQVSKELRALESVVLAKPSAKAPSVTIGNTHNSVDGPELQLMLRKTGKDWVLIITNTAIHGMPFTLSGLPESLNGKRFYRLYSDEYHDIENGTFKDGIAGFEVHVYATSRRFEAN
ncbi:MAG: beta-galactosidase [Planctomycetota bacterium]|jgi:hypothetical protein